MKTLHDIRRELEMLAKNPLCRTTAKLLQLAAELRAVIGEDEVEL